MVRKIYRKLTKEQKERGVVFASTLSTTTSDDVEGRTTHEITREEWRENEKEARQKMQRLKDDKFFNRSHFRYNIIRE